MNSVPIGWERHLTDFLLSLYQSRVWEETTPYQHQMILWLCWQHQLETIKDGKHKSVMEEFQFLIKHADRRHETTFSKCHFLGQVICDYFKEKPTRCEKALKATKKSGGGLLESPPSAKFECHYMTYLEMCSKSKRGKNLPNQANFYLWN